MTDNILYKLLCRKFTYVFVFTVMVNQPEPASQKAYGKEVTVKTCVRMFCCQRALFLKYMRFVTSADPHLVPNAGLERSNHPKCILMI